MRGGGGSGGRAGALVEDAGDIGGSDVVSADVEEGPN